MSKKKAPARGTRKSIVEEYKAKARGRVESAVSEDPTNSVQLEKLKKKQSKKPLRKSIKKKQKVSKVFPDYNPILSMTIGDETYEAGDIAWYVLESAQSKRPRSGEIKECYPSDATEPCVCVLDLGMGNYRTVRASLVGWNKAEAKEKWTKFVEARPLKNTQ